MCPSRPGGFTDCTREAGQAQGTFTWDRTTDRYPVNGAALLDCDGDDLPDAVTFNWVAAPTLARNRGGFRFEDATTEALRAVGPAMAVAPGDLDADGHTDLVLARSPLGAMGPPVEVLRGTGRCGWERVTARWGFDRVAWGPRPVWSGVALHDLDLDGRLDVFVWSSLPTELGGGGAPVVLVARPDLT